METGALFCEAVSRPLPWANGLTKGIVQRSSHARPARDGVRNWHASRRVRPPANGFGGPDGYKTHGIVCNPLDSDAGRRLVASYTSQGMSPFEALDKASELMASGSSMPEAIALVAGDCLYKLVPAGAVPGKCSAFFATADEMSVLKGMSFDQLCDRIGFPLESQQTRRFDIYEVVAKHAITVFTSTIAGTTQNGYRQSGGGTQTMITNRSAFSVPVLIGTFPCA